MMIISCGDGVIRKQDFDLPPQAEKKSKPSQNISFNFSQCITGDLPTAQSGPDGGTKDNYFSPDGQQVIFSYKRIESSSELRELLKKQAGFSAKSSLGQIEAGLASHDGWSTSSDERYFYTKIEVSNPIVVMKNIKLSDEAYHLLKRKGRESFRLRCGDEAKIGYKSGGTLSQVIRMSKSKQDSKDSIDALIQASGLKIGSNGQIQSDDTTDTSELQVDIFTQWQGGLGEFASTNIRDLRVTNERWPQTVAQHGVVSESITISYDKLISHLEDPYDDLITNEIHLFRQQLRRLSQIKTNILSLSKGDQTISTQNLKKLESLIITVTQKIRACEKTTKIEKCQDLNLLFTAKDFVLSTPMIHQSCGVKSQHKPPQPVCTTKTVTTWETKPDPSCPVESYHGGIMFQKTFTFRSKKKDKYLAKKFDKICHDKRIKRRIDYAGSHIKKQFRRPCTPMSDACLFEDKIDVTYHSYVLSCRGENPKFGVKSYQACPVATSALKTDCHIPEAKPIQMEYKRCVVALDQSL